MCHDVILRGSSVTLFRRYSSFEYSQIPQDFANFVKGGHSVQWYHLCDLVPI